MLSKSLDLCASSQNQQTPWQYYNNGLLERDDTFSIVELCHFNFQSTMTQVRHQLSSNEKMEKIELFSYANKY